MSQLITIAERIKVITNIQKTTHAMQLISMSALSRIGSKKKALEAYTRQLEALSEELGLTRTSNTPLQGLRKIYLIMGSQKGFCGGFNNTLFTFIKELRKKDSGTFSCIPLGPYAYDFCKEQKMNLLTDKITYSLMTISEKTNLIFNEIMALKDSFDTISVISNYSASIFLQRPHETILPLSYSFSSNKALQTSEYTLEQPVEEIIDYVSKLTLKTQIFQLLLESLRAENGARALSMDNSTRNAKNLLSEMKLIYNKLRQAKVTKELTELSSSLLD